MIASHSPDIIALSETWLKPETPFSISGYTTTRADREDGYGGVLIACKNTIMAAKVTVATEYECVVCRIKLEDSRELHIASAYLAPPTSSTVTKSGLDSLMQQIPPPRLILGDFNAQGQQWGNPTNDRRATLLMAVFDDHNLSTLNTGEPTSIARPPVRSSALDLSVCSADISLDCDWHLLDHPHGSDHIPILITYPPSASAPTNPRNDSPTTISTNNINWAIFKECVQLGMSVCDNPQETAIERYTTLHEVMIESARSAAKPRFSAHHQPHKPKVWWCPELSQLYARKRKAFTLFKKHGGRIEYDSFQEAESTFDRRKNELKRASWRDFCSTLTKDTPLTKMFEMARRYRGHDKQQQRVMSTGEWQAEFACKLAPSFVAPPPRSATAQHQRVVHALDKDYTHVELDAALRNCSNTSPGLDGISFNMLKQLPNETKK